MSAWGGINVRARNIKPGFFKNEALAECEPMTRLLFIGLWCLADRMGRMEYRPRRFKAELFPYENCDIEGMINTLAEKGFLVCYNVNDIQYIAIVNFSKHQNPHIKEAKSVLPEPPEANIVQTPCEHGANTVQAHLIPDSLIPDSLIPDSLIPDSKPSPKVAPKKKKQKSVEPDDDAIFMEFWNAYPRQTGKFEAYRCWINTQRQFKASPEVLITAAMNYADKCKELGTEERFIKHPSTFLGPSRPWNDFIKTSQTSRRPEMTEEELQENEKRIKFYAGLEKGDGEGV